MKCQTCHTNEQIISPNLGVLDCLDCQEKQSKLKSPARSIEFTTESIKWDRKEYERDTVQPTRGEVLSKEFIDIHGKETVKEILKVTDEDIENAQYVWDQDSYYKHV